MRGRWIAVVALTTMTFACGGSSKSEDATGGTTASDASDAAASAPAAEPATTVAAAADPASTVPAVTEPAVTEPAVTEPAVTEPAVDDTFPVLDTTASVDVEFTGEGSGPFCDIVRELDGNDPINDAFDTTDPAVAKAAWADVESAFDRLEGAAPDEISGDVSTLAGIFDSMKQFFEGFDFDMQAASLAMESDPEMVALLSGEDPTAQDASDRLDAYGVQVCGLAS